MVVSSNLLVALEKRKQIQNSNICCFDARFDQAAGTSLPNELRIRSTRSATRFTRKVRFTVCQIHVLPGSQIRIACQIARFTVARFSQIQYRAARKNRWLSNRNNMPFQSEIYMNFFLIYQISEVGGSEFAFRQPPP